MELRQLRAFVRVIEVGSISRAAIDLNVVQSALSQQISKLEASCLLGFFSARLRASRPPKQAWLFFEKPSSR